MQSKTDKRTAVRLSHQIALGLLFAVTAACSKTRTETTSLAITVASDLAVLNEVDRLDVEYTTPRGSRTDSLALTAQMSFPITLTPVVSPGPAGEEITIRVTGFLKNVAVVSQKLLTAMIKDEHAALTVVLSRSCVAFVTLCNEETVTCFEGGCIPIPRRVATVIKTIGGGEIGEDAGLPVNPVNTLDASEPAEGCKNDIECPTGHCADGVCCDVACLDKCHACNLPGNRGTCSQVAANTLDPHGLCAKQGPCGTSGLCDSSGECSFYGNSQTCGDAQSCENGKYTPQSFCSGSGTCITATAVPCPNGVACIESMCRGSCTADAECASLSLYCDNRACKQKVSNGVACAAGKSNGCISGNCVDGVCCGSASCASCQRCDLNGAGTCSFVAAGQPDPTNICVDQGAPSCGNTGVCDKGGSCQKYACTCDGFAMPNPTSAGLPNPASYTSGAGFVTDNVTKLVWEQPISATTFTQPNAIKYCSDKGSGWRLPTVVELISLVDFTRANPSIDIAAFPNTPATPFWTSTAVAGDPAKGWILYFTNGYSSYVAVSYSTPQVRCVR